MRSQTPLRYAVLHLPSSDSEAIRSPQETHGRSINKIRVAVLNRGVCIFCTTGHMRSRNPFAPAESVQVRSITRTSDNRFDNFNCPVKHRKAFGLALFQATASEGCAARMKVSKLSTLTVALPLVRFLGIARDPCH